MEKILVLGIGNILLGDEGVGVHVVKDLERFEMPSHVTLLDGGTGGFHLLNWLQEYGRIIMIDATLDGKPPGSISIVQPRFSNEFPRTLSSHDIGLKDLIDSASLLGNLPEITLFTVSVHPEQSLTMELSAVISESAAKISLEIRKLLSIGV
jgi:hydrogenase maturation protease